MLQKLFQGIAAFRLLNGYRSLLLVKFQIRQSGEWNRKVRTCSIWWKAVWVSLKLRVQKKCLSWNQQGSSDFTWGWLEKCFEEPSWVQLVKMPVYFEGESGLRLSPNWFPSQNRHWWKQFSRFRHHRSPQAPHRPPQAAISPHKLPSGPHMPP